MEQEKQRIKIAELQGWKYQPYKPGNPSEWIRPDGFPCGHKLAGLPDYLNSRDALAPVLAGLSHTEFTKFRWILWDLCKAFMVDDWNRNYLLATPSQLCEAYLRTKGEWEE